MKSSEKRDGEPDLSFIDCFVCFYADCGVPESRNGPKSLVLEVPGPILFNTKLNVKRPGA